MQPRGRSGRWVCDPSYPRRVASPCGCAGGGSRPCPVRRRHRQLRQDARNVARRQLRGRRLAEDVRQLEEDLYVTRMDREATREAVTHTREQVRNAGARGRRGARTIHGSEDAYRDLVERRRDELAHLAHLRREVASIRQALIRARGRARRAA